jgi:isoleucyl-tRNA synthetase
VDEAALRAVEAIIRDEVNVKTLDAIPAGSGAVVKRARPNFKALGRRLGPKMKVATEAIKGLSTEQIEAYEREGALTLDLAGAPETFAAGDLDITSEGVEGRLVAQEAGVTVSLDPTLTPELRAEGLAREFVNRIQQLRKQAGFEVSDRIGITFAGSRDLHAAIAVHGAAIRAETLATTLAEAEAPEGDAVEAFEIAGEPVRIAAWRTAAVAEAAPIRA